MLSRPTNNFLHQLCCFLYKNVTSIDVSVPFNSTIFVPSFVKLVKCVANGDVFEHVYPPTRIHKPKWSRKQT